MSFSIVIHTQHLGPQEKSVPLQIGACIFSSQKSYAHVSFSRNVHYDEATSGLDENTKNDYRSKIDTHQPETLGNSVPLAVALTDFSMFPEVAANISWLDIDAVWGVSHIDQALIARAFYEQFGLLAPWKPGTERCVSTLFNIAGGYPSLKHNIKELSASVDFCVMKADIIRTMLAKVKR